MAKIVIGIASVAKKKEVLYSGGLIGAQKKI